jgi:hypothetical protein
MSVFAKVYNKSHVDGAVSFHDANGDCVKLGEGKKHHFVVKAQLTWTVVGFVETDNDTIQIYNKERTKTIYGSMIVVAARNQLL